MNRSTKTALILAAKLAATLATLAAVAHLNGCNTVQGVGRDITAVGEGGQDLIDEATGSPSTKH